MGFGEGLNTTDVAKMKAEKHYMYVKNGTGSATVVGNVVNFDVSSSTDGLTVKQPATANLSAFAGVCLEAKADGDAVKIQTLGPVDAYVSGNTGSALGDVLITANGVDYFTRSGAADGKPAFAVLCEAYTATTPALKSVLVFGSYTNNF